MNHFPLLSLLTFLPLIGAGLIFFLRGDELHVSTNARWIALWTAFIEFAVSLILWLNFDNSDSGFQFQEKAAWLPTLNINYHMGVDGISLFLIILSTLLTPICVISTWNSVTYRIKEYMLSFLVLETMMVGTFCALDLIVFYAFFEGVLIPMFLIIGIWGGKRRVYASFKFFLYTLLGSVLMLLAILMIAYELGTTDLVVAMDSSLPVNLQYWLWVAFFASFAVKVPMWPVHTWLPDAHVEAPTAGSVILAGVLLKMGGYGFIRFSIPILPEASVYFTPLIFWLSVIGIIYTSLVALAQEDMKKLIAYSSIAHMGIVTIGIFTLTSEGVIGAMFQMLSHGIVSAALFLCVGVVYDRLHTREITRYGGLADNMPNYSLVFMIFMLASVGLPSTAGFVGEFLSLLGAFQVDSSVAFFATSSLILGATYMLYLYRRIIFGALVRKDVKEMFDLTLREKLMFTPLLCLVFWMGVYPTTFIDPMKPAIQKLIDRGHIPIKSSSHFLEYTGSVVK